ncbi:hypothetical protein AC1031_007905 [Aphanomyces cochlioides]|nr:hypothetical protein AC1031_007905 [Aphanomyces cochlioides]
MKLTLKAFGSLEVDYLFDMAPLSIEKVDMLEAKVRDLEKVVEGKPAIFSLVYLSLKSTKAVKTGQFVVWDTPKKTNTAYFELSYTKDQIKISKPGLYQIQMTGRMQNWNSSCNYKSVHLLEDDEIIANALVSYDGSYYCTALNHTLLTNPWSQIKFQVGANFGLKSGAQLNIFLLQGV